MSAASTPAPTTRIALWGLGVALALAAFLIFWGLPSQSLYIDEAFTLDAVARPLGDMFQFLAAHDAHPPLFYVLAHAAVTTLHWQPTWFRFLTAPFGLLTVACTWWLARRSFGVTAAVVAAIVVATEPTLLLFDRFFRMYGPFAALTALSFVLLLRAIDAGAPSKSSALRWASYALCAVVLPYVLYLGGIVVSCQCAYAFFDLRRRWPTLAAGALSFVALTPWWWAIARQLPQAGFAGGSAIAAPWQLARFVLGYATPVDWYKGGAFDVPFTIAVLCTIGGAIWLGRGGVVAAYAAPLLVQCVATFALHRNLAYGRYLLHLVPAFAIAVGGVVAAAMRPAWRVLGLVLVAAVLALNGTADANLELDKFYQISDWNMVANIFAASEQPSDAVVIEQGYAYLVLRTYPAFSGHPIAAPQEPTEVRKTIVWLDQHPYQRVWYIENEYEYTDPTRLVKAHLEATRPRLREWLEVKADAGNTVFFALYGTFAQHRKDR